MRLVCPNCEAKYEVPEDAIPETGRDVQCANCGHAWFQMRPRPSAAETAPVPPPPVPPPAPVPEAPAADVRATEPSAVAEAISSEAAPAPAPEAAPAPDPVPDPLPEPAMPAADPVAVTTEPVAEPAPQAAVDASMDEPADLAAPAGAATPIEPSLVDAPVVEAAADRGTIAAPDVPSAPAEPVTAVTHETPDGEDRDDVTPEVPAAVATAAYAVDESVLAILREEAEREAKARQAEASKPLETQADLGIDQAMPMAGRMRDAAAEDPALLARRARLPDVEEINSTLRPSAATVDDGAPAAMPVEVEGRSSFRSGFLLVLTVAILGSAVYGSADMIAEFVPALAGPLKSYVSFVDSLRLQLDGLMQSATVAINGT